jgi:hypothetical protein
MTKKYQLQNISNLLCTVFVFFLILGFKVSFIDLSLWVPLFIVAISRKNLLKMNRIFFQFSIFILILLSYQALLQIFHLTSDNYSLLRLLRAAFVCMLIAIIIGGNIFSSTQILHSLFFTFLFHAILINAAAIYDPLNQFLVNFSGNDRVRPFRASGLLAGFDMAGLFCLLGLLLLALNLIDIKHAIFRLFFYLTFFLGAFFTSRITLLLFSSIFIVKLLFYLTSSRDPLSKRISIFLIITTASIYIFYIYLLPVFELTFSLGLIDVSDSQAEDISSRNSLNSGESWREMLFFPKDFSSLFFGTGADQPNSDIGYVKDIFRYGVIGVLFSLTAHFFILFFSSSLKYTERKIRIFQWCIFCLMLLMSVKNNYFFTRGIFSVFLLSLCVETNSLRSEFHRKLTNKEAISHEK